MKKKEMKKKLLAGVMGILMVGAMGTSAFAAETTNITTTVKADYTLTIPAATTIAFGAETTNLSGKLKASGNINADQKLTVTATANPLQVATDKTKEIPYTLKNGAATFTSDSWSEAELRDGLASADAGKSIQLSVNIVKAAWEAAKAGTYEGSITFEAKIV
ncbi:MAG: hypothetical protein RR626_07200 [Anaerovoracaceae bacterium]